MKTGIVMALFTAFVLWIAPAKAPAQSVTPDCFKARINGKPELIVRHGAKRYFCRRV